MSIANHILTVTLICKTHVTDTPCYSTPWWNCQTIALNRLLRCTHRFRFLHLDWPGNPCRDPWCDSCKWHSCQQQCLIDPLCQYLARLPNPDPKIAHPMPIEQQHSTIAYKQMISKLHRVKIVIRLRDRFKLETWGSPSSPRTSASCHFRLLTSLGLLSGRLPFVMDIKKVYVWLRQAKSTNEKLKRM